MEKGCVQVYTGNGKGKTTAAFGLALRASCAGLKVIIIQFLKGQDCAELKAAEYLPNLTIERYGRENFVIGKPAAEDIELAAKTLARVKKAVSSGEYDVVIADEFNSAVAAGLFNVESALDTIKARNPGTELVLTGRNARPEVMEAADLVTEMVEHKHYYSSGVPARKGIEY